MMRLFVLILLALASQPAAYAEGSDTSGQRVNVITDQKNGAVIFEIDGKPVAQIDARGLWALGVRVQGNVSYSGVLADVDGKDTAR